ncbi:MAG TPA: ABC transporter ATP-binding protein [Lachnospiraceae bacterium]|nr:ABC transporter ATP-binding protein [Lachnospiraceae bacterium]
MEDYSIKIDNVTKIYNLYNKPTDRLREALSITKKSFHKKYYALDSVSFTIKKGETVGIIGENGAGKSTLLKVITGILSPNEGTVDIRGRISALLELGAGFNGEYTGLENIYLNGTMMGYTRQEVDARLKDILDFADIGDFINQPVKTYSSGMFVRLAFAVAINIDPEILIVDEALSVGDVFFQAKCYKKIEEFKSSGKTILLVSHSLSSINKYCDRVILMNKGKKLDEGEPSQMIDKFKKVLVNQLESEIVLDEVGLDASAPVRGKWKENMVVNPNIDSYGNSFAEIFDFCILDSKGEIGNKIEKGTPFTVKMAVRFNVEIKEPIFAFTILDLKGTEITGTNTMYEKTYIPDTKKGDIREIAFTQRMNLQGGEYLLSLGCTGFKDGEFTVYHRLYQACNITVISDKDTVGFYDMESTIEVK